MIDYSRPILALAAALAAVVLLARCGGLGDRALAPPEEAGVLVVATLKGPTTYDKAEDGPAGYEVELARAFAESLGVRARFLVRSDIDSVIADVEAGRAHVAAAGLTATGPRRERIAFGPAYKTIREQLVCRRGGPAPKRRADLAEARIAVVADSSYVGTLEDIAAQHPDLRWGVRRAGSAMPLLEAVEQGRIDCTVADSHLVAVARLTHPELITPMNLTGDRPLAWAVGQQAESLQGSLRAWFAEAHANGALAELDERWYGHANEFDYVDARSFIRRIDERLPRYQQFFKAAASDVPVDWRLLAAQAYQESHWDPLAESPTGVRGLMMLTLPTASEVGVDNRLDPRQSVEGGAAYLAGLMERLPEDIAEEDRVWFALAAYNVGMGHIYDARRLAERRGLDKSSWEHVSGTLPLLTQPEHYASLPHGYARGHEPVRYVRKIRKYYAMLYANRAG